MNKIKCRSCKKISIRYSREAKYFCNRECYFNWKRKYKPTKIARKEKIYISGYYYIYMPSHPNSIKNNRYIAEHRLIAEKKIGRLLDRNEHVHHLNGNKLDNNPDNLKVLSSSDHMRITALERNRKKNGRFKK